MNVEEKAEMLRKMSDEKLYIKKFLEMFSRSTTKDRRGQTGELMIIMSIS